MKTTLILGLFLTIICWSCSNPLSPDKDTGKEAPSTESVDNDKKTTDPFRLQLQRFGYDVVTGKYVNYRSYPGDRGC